jgi:hypothetical protein
MSSLVRACNRPLVQRWLVGAWGLALKPFPAIRMQATLGVVGENAVSHEWINLADQERAISAVTTQRQGSAAALGAPPLTSIAS